ncbi:histidine kinase [Polaromonas sp. SM01]|uniref:sensor histidine kinase n=1 Tax=Polaromonas sp. SM01 TaxID=3085630 RepID=UPI0029823C41|nr:histidine kinase [Polaromonas sp. SM01]MDW5441183.1 histidine kinase [Polaromonas sp. SM01]
MNIKSTQQQGQEAGSTSAGVAMVHAPLGEQLPHVLRAMVEGLHAGVLISNERQVIYSNPEISRLLGYGPDESLAGMLITDLVADGDQQLALQRRKAVVAGRRIPTGWLKLKGKDGELVQMMPKLSCVILNGQPHFITAVHRASDHHLLEIQARKARAGYERLLATELDKQQSAIARELHDSLGSELTGISLMLGSLKGLVPDDAVLSVRLDNVMGQLQGAIEMTRGLARGLMPVDTYAGGFGHAMERLASDWTLLKGVPCEFRMSGPFDDVPAETGVHLYRIAQEGIVNALRHGKATRIRLKLTDRRPDLMLEIEDNGIGFGASIISAGMGVRSMMARAESIGGRIEFSPGRRSGSCVKVIWPADRFAPNLRLPHD